MAPATRSLQGAATLRIDGRDKVTGAARYGSDFAPGAVAWAYLKTSAIAKGQIVEFDERAARAVPGIIDILTWREVGERVAPGKMMLPDGYMGSTIAPLRSAQILHAGQIVAVAVAETFEAAREAAHVLEVRYEAATPSGSFDDAGVTTAPAGKKDPHVGDFDAAFATAPVRVDARYETATQHHNPIELFTTVAAWDGDSLTIWESSQNVWGFKNGLAEQLGISPDDIRVVAPFVGGAFGSRGSLTQRTALIALAARRVNRPVKLVATSRSGFQHCDLPRGDPPPRATRRHAAGQTGGITSRRLGGNLASRSLLGRRHGCQHPAVRLRKRRLPGQSSYTPTATRRDSCAAPPETPYLFALECCHGRARLCARDGPDRAAAAQRHRGRTHQGPALYEPSR